MSAATLLSELAERGIRLEASGDRLRYSPRAAMTPDLAERMKAHKPELIAALRRGVKANVIDPTSAPALWHAAVDSLEGDPLFPAETLKALREAEVHWASEETASLPDSTETDPVVEQRDAVDPIDDWDDLPDLGDPCPDCGSLTFWWNYLGEARCQSCHPLDESHRRMQDAIDVRRRADRRQARRNG